MNYAQLKKLDDETLAKITEGLGPSDECLCSLLAPEDSQKKGFKHSLKRAFASISQAKGLGMGQKKGRNTTSAKNGVTADVKGIDYNTVDIPLAFGKGGRAVYTTNKETVKRSSPCGKCGCDEENIVLKHSVANIRITSPDVSSFCPCPTDCLPDKEKFNNNIKVTIERLSVEGAPAMAGVDVQRTESAETADQSLNSVED